MTWQLLRDYGVQVFIAVDQLCNALIPPLDGTLGYADETLSARSYRAHRDGKVVGRLSMPVIDLLFRWQGPRHCYRAFIHEHERHDLPNDYRATPAAFFSPASRPPGGEGRGDDRKEEARP